MYKCQLLPLRKVDQGLFSRFSAARLRTGCQLLQLSLCWLVNFTVMQPTFISKVEKSCQESCERPSAGLFECPEPQKGKPTALSPGVSPLRFLTGLRRKPRRRRCLIWVGPSRLIGSMLWTSTALVFFFNEWILHNSVGCWWLDLDWKFYST